MESRRVPYPIDQVENRIKQYFKPTWWHEYNPQTEGDGDLNPSAFYYKGRWITDDKVSVECKKLGDNYTEIILDWKSGTPAFEAGCWVFLVLGVSALAFITIFFNFFYAAVYGASTGTSRVFREMVIGIVVISSILGLFYIGDKWFSGNRQEIFWKTAGWDEISGAVIVGELMPQEGSASGSRTKFLGMGFVLLVFILFHIPPIIILILLVQLYSELISPIWKSSPVLYWKAGLLESTLTPIRSASFGVILLFYTLTFFSLIIGWATVLLVSSSLAEPVPRINQGPDEIFNTLSLMDRAWRGGTSELQTSISTVAKEAGIQISSENVFPQSELGQVAFLLFDKFTDEDQADDVERFKSFSLIAFLTVAAVWVLSFTSEFITTPRKWRKRYGQLYRASQNLKGIRIKSPTWIQLGLFNAWAIALWLVSIVASILAIGLVFVQINNFFFRQNIPLLDQYTLPFNFFSAVVEVNHFHLQPMRVLLLLLTITPFLIVVFLSIVFWLSNSGSLYFKLLFRTARREDRQLWDQFRARYGLPGCFLVLDPHCKEIEYNATWLGQLIAVPPTIWDWYVNGRGRLSCQEIELLLLHEFGHAKQIEISSLTRLLGAITFVGQGYFQVCKNTIRDEYIADDFALKRYQEFGDAAAVPSALTDAIRRYEILWSMYKVPRKRTANSLPRKVLSALSPPVGKVFQFYYGQDNLGYVHPELILREQQLVIPELYGHDRLKSILATMVSLLVVALLASMALKYLPLY